MNQPSKNKRQKPVIWWTDNKHDVRITSGFTIIQPPREMRCWVVWEDSDDCWIEGPIPVLAIRITQETIEGRALCRKTQRQYEFKGDLRTIVDTTYLDPDGIGEFIGLREAANNGFEEAYANVLVLGDIAPGGGSPFSWIDDSHVRFTESAAESLRQYLNEQAREKAERKAAKGDDSQ